MTPVVRPFTLSDRTELITAIDAVCGEGRWMSTRRFEPTPLWTHALAEPACPHHLLLVVEDADRVVGWCRTFPLRCQDNQPEATLGIGLLAQYRDQGLGTLLIQRSLHWACARGFRCVRLTTRSDNARAIHVFTRCGFAFTGQIRDGMIEMAYELPVEPNLAIAHIRPARGFKYARGNRHECIV